MTSEIKSSFAMCGVTFNVTITATQSLYQTRYSGKLEVQNDTPDYGIRFHINRLLDGSAGVSPEGRDAYTPREIECKFRAIAAHALASAGVERPGISWLNRGTVRVVNVSKDARLSVSATYVMRYLPEFVQRYGDAENLMMVKDVNLDINFYEIAGDYSNRDKTSCYEKSEVIGVLGYLLEDARADGITALVFRYHDE